MSRRPHPISITRRSKTIHLEVTLRSSTQWGTSHHIESCKWPDKSKSEINQGYFYNYQYIILLTWIFIFAHIYAKEGPDCTLSFDILWCFHLTPSGNPFCCQPFYELFLESLNPFDPSDLFDVSRTEYFSILIGRLDNVGNAQFHSIQKASRWQGRTT